MSSYLKMVWDTMASEYYSDIHKTSRNFDRIIHGCLLKVKSKLPLDGLYLDLGGGKGRLKELFADTRLNVAVGDISVAMMKTRTGYFGSTSYIQMDAFRSPFKENIFDGVFSLLGDPYSLRKAFEEVFRILKHSGFFFIALPSRLWAENLRPQLGVGMDQTVFKTLTGGSVKVPSFLYDSKDLEEILLSVGFRQVETGDWQASSLISEEQFSRDVLVSARNLEMLPEELPLVTYALAHKSSLMEEGLP